METTASMRGSPLRDCLRVLSHPVGQLCLVGLRSAARCRDGGIVAADRENPSRWVKSPPGCCAAEGGAMVRVETSTSGLARSTAVGREPG
jgi:hypothetical protein